MNFIENLGEGFAHWVRTHGIEVVVFDMDCTMSTSHCGAGLKKEEFQQYIDNASVDFITAIGALSKMETIGCAVATGSDALEYDIPGQSRESHILGADLASALIENYCPAALHKFGLMVGYDHRLHATCTPRGEGEGETLSMEGKRHHMRLIQQHYGVPFHKMVLFDDHPSSLPNEDGWIGIKVDPLVGFAFKNIPKELPLFSSADGYMDNVLGSNKDPALPVTSLDDTVDWYGRHFGLEVIERCDDEFVVMMRDGVRIGFVINGMDASEDGAVIRVHNIYRMRSIFSSLGVEIDNWQIDIDSNGISSQVFYVRAPDGLCYYFYQPLKPPATIA